MFKKIALLSLIFIFFSCEKEQSTYTINATIDTSEANSRKAEIYRVDNRKKVVKDSATVNDGKIVFKGSVENPDIYYIKIDGIKDALPIILENADINITFYKDSLSKSIITGGKQNSITKTYKKESSFLREYNNSLRERFQEANKVKDTTEIAAVRKSYDSLVKAASQFDLSFIKKYPNTAFAAITLERLAKGKSITEEESKEAYNSLSKDIKQTRAAKETIALLDKKNNDKKAINKTVTKAAAVTIGNIAPNFSGLTPEGKSLELKNIKAKVTIIDFWASWCGPCRRENPNVVKMYNKYHSKGLEIIGVSLDKQGQKDRWLKAIEKDKLTWQHVSNLKGWQEPIAVQYGVRSIPATFILDESGTIIAKNLRGQALENKVAELLN